MEDTEHQHFNPEVPIQPTWELRDEIGILPALRASLIELIIRPQATFSAMPVKGEWQGPVLFAAITSIAALFLYVLIHVGPINIIYNIKYDGLSLQDLSSQDIYLLIFWTVLPGSILALCGATLPFLYGIIIHVTLMACRYTSAGWQGSLRACFYAWGAAAPFFILPTCIPIAFAIALYRGTYYAIMEVQHVPSGKAKAVAIVNLLLITFAAFTQLGSAFAIGMAILRS